MTRRNLSYLVLAAMLPGLAGCEHLGIFEPFREVSCFEAATVSLSDAVSIAQGGDGRALDADYRQDQEMGCLQGDPGVYDITLLASGMIYTVSVDAKTRQIGPRQVSNVTTQLLSGSPFPGSPADMARIVPRLSIDMLQAIDIAEQQGGKAMVAWIEEMDGRAGYTMKLVQGGRVRETWILGERGT